MMERVRAAKDEALASETTSWPDRTAVRRNLEVALRLYILLLTVIFVIEWGSAGYHARVLHSAYPYTTPLFYPDARYSDWSNFLLRVSHFGEPEMQVRPDLGLPYPYPLPSMFLFLLFIRLFHAPQTAYVFFTLAAFISVTLAFWSYLYRGLGAGRLVLFAVWITLLFGSPAMFLLDRGNIEVFLWLFVVAGLVSFVRDWKYTAAFFFALAACMKIYPALYFLLFLPRRQYKAAALGCVLTAGFSVAALAVVGPTVAQALHNMSAATAVLRDLQIIALWEPGLRFDHSLLALFKQSYYVALVPSHPGFRIVPPTFERAVRVYSVLAALGFAAIYLLRLRRMPLLNQFMAFTIFSVLLPYVSYEYTLVHIYLVFAVLLIFLLQDGNALPHVFSPAKLNVTMICFAILFAPLAYLAHEMCQGQVKAIALVALLGVALGRGMPSTLFRDRSLSGDSAA
jgi:hypothetical protein